MQELKRMLTKSRVVTGLALVVLLLTSADHWTTYICLRAPVPGWEVMEANPLAEWLFGSTGLVAGLAFDSLITVAAILYLLATDLFPPVVKASFLSVMTLATGYAVANNLMVVQDMGLSTFGFGA